MFFVAGLPVTQGSKRAIVHKSTGRAVVIESSNRNLGAWRHAIAQEARRCIPEPIDRDGGRGRPVWLTLDFYLSRPASLPKRHGFPTSRPDVDKLSRAAFDALSGVAYLDDSQVVSLTVSKRFADAPGVWVRVWDGGI